MKANLIEETGNRYGKLLVISRAGNAGNGRSRWLCQCDCGSTKTVAGTALRFGAYRSCGCGKSHPTHGLHKSRVYTIYYGVRKRCTDPKHHGYEQYGGRGITVCERWLGTTGFVNFLADVGEPPPGTSLDRIDPNKGYEPANVRWALPREQAANRRASTPRMRRLISSEIDRIRTGATTSYSRDALLDIVGNLRRDILGS